MKEFVDFLGGQPPFDALGAEDLALVVARLEVEYFAAGATVVRDGEPLAHLGRARRAPRAAHRPGTGRARRLGGARLGLPVHTPHHALGDAFTTAQLLLAPATPMEVAHRGRQRPLTVGNLCAVSRHHRR